VKSIDAKKIAAVTAGVALLGASLLAAAPIMYGNTEIINAQGKPVVKVVVGANAKASDGVAAANIAAVIGSLAYKSQTVTAQLQGSPTCSVGAAGAGGACTVSDKKVALEITTPGTSIVAGAYGFRTYMYGFLDDNTSTEDNQLADGSAKKITGDNFVSFQDAKSSISSVSGQFTTKQEAYVKTGSAPTFYTDVKKYKIIPQTLNYVIKFEHDTFNGIPTCTWSNVYSSTTAGMTTTSSLEGNCTPTESYMMSRQRLKVKYLGEDWIVSEMKPLDSPSSIKLAKESTPAQIVYAGQNVTAGAYIVKLADLTIPYGTTDSQAVLQIYDANNNLVKEDTVTTATAKEITLPNADKITIRVYKTAPGLTAAKWAEMSVLSQELTLTNGRTVDSDLNKNWTVSLAWGTSSGGIYNFTLKNITMTGSSLPTLAAGESINMIGSPALFKMAFSGTTLTDASRDTLQYSFIQNPSYYGSESDTNAIASDPLIRYYVCAVSAKKAFAFTTAPASSDDRSKVCFGLGNATPLLYEKPDKGYIRYVPTTTTGLNVILNLTHNITVFNGTGWQILLNDSIGNYINLTKNWTDIAGVNYTFRFQPTVNYSYENATDLWTVTNSNITSIPTGSYAMFNKTDIGGSCGVDSTICLRLINASYMPTSVPYPFDLENATLVYNIQDNSAENGNLTFRTTGVDSGTLQVTEFANKGGGSTQSSLATTFTNISFVANGTATTFKSSSGSETKIDATYLTATGTSSASEFEAGYMSQRGSTIDSRASNSITLKMAKKLGEFQYQISASGANTTSAGVSTVNLAEGGQVSVQDSTVKVKTITETVGACTVSGGNASCTVDKSPMKAVLDTGAASGDFSVPYKLGATDRLVVLDSEAPSAESLILVGGQLVNTVTARTISGTDVKVDRPGVKVVKAVTDQRIVVAGYTADDTSAAASQFISELLAKA
jgi:hypothetical protein